LFESALKLHKDSGKHVHILIDEIDSVLRKPELSRNGDSNLTLEFQTLMDGVVHYPSLSVWGATNTPQNIPIAMIRRFSKVLIVGELDNEQRTRLLKNFTDYIPLSSEFSDQAWGSLAQKLEGATGDVIRKVADHIWREKMSAFVNNNQHEAEKLVKWLNEDHKFEISKFSTEKRAQLKKKLSKFTKVSPEDVEASITIHLENIAIRNEIDTAIKTYANAKAFLDQLKNKKAEQPVS
jgi:SpoVK/Ycf46/Vps4 family AAA+-type ATPase